MKYCFVLITFILFHLQLLYAQPIGVYSSTNKKAIKFFEIGKNAFQESKDELAQKNLLKCLELDSFFVEAHTAVSQIFFIKKDFKQSIKHLKKAIQINPKFYTRNYFDLACAQFLLEQYDDSKKNFETFLSFNNISPALKTQAELCFLKANFACNAIKNPVSFILKNMGDKINSDEDEYFPAISGDESTFVFTRKKNRQQLNTQQQNDENFYVSEQINYNWVLAEYMSGVNTIANEGAPSLSTDGNTMFFASCMEMDGTYGAPNRKGFGSCDIFYSQKYNGKWTPAVNIGAPINTNNWETQPSFSSDGKTLYFVRGIISKEGIRNSDIYYSTLDEYGKFSIPQPVSTYINTTYSEESVFIHPDNQTLYFSSNGHPGMGGLDIYMSKKEVDGTWGKPINLGYPINTVNDESSILISPNGQHGYFSSNKEKGFGGLDLYQFDLPDAIKPNKITYIKGIVYNAITKTNIESTIEIIDIDQPLFSNKFTSNLNGFFFVTLTSGHNYIISITKNGYLFYSNHFLLKETETNFNEPYKLNIPLQPIQNGLTIELKNVFFDINKADLKPTSMIELNKIVTLLNNNPKLNVEFGGHTDNTGDKKINLLLSTNRAKAVYDYILTTGVDAKRLSYKGYGDTMPVIENSTPENKTKNRRTELKVISK